MLNLNCLIQSEEKPQPGDLIEIFRGTYQHWAIYVGDGFVIHLAPPCESVVTLIKKTCHHTL